MLNFVDVLSLKFLFFLPTTTLSMARSATSSKMSKAEVMRAEAAPKMKEMEAAIRQAEIEEELECQWEEEEASKRWYDEELQAAKELEKKRKSAMAARPRARKQGSPQKAREKVSGLSRWMKRAMGPSCLPRRR